LVLLKSTTHKYMYKITHMIYVLDKQIDKQIVFKGYHSTNDAEIHSKIHVDVSALTQFRYLVSLNSMYSVPSLLKRRRA